MVFFCRKYVMCDLSIRVVSKSCLLFFLFSSFGFTQLVAQEDYKIRIAGQDSTFVDAISLEEVELFSQPNFKSREEWYRYYVIRKRLLKVYPYAEMAANRLDSLDNRLNQINRKSKRKAYTRKLEKFLAEELTADLKKLTRSEGKILIRLVYRQTGISAFSVVKEYRNGLRAFVYQTTARLFDMSLKRIYDPYEEYEDYLIENILQIAFSQGVINSQKAAISIDYEKCYGKWSLTKKD